MGQPQVRARGGRRDALVAVAGFGVGFAVGVPLTYLLYKDFVNLHTVTIACLGAALALLLQLLRKLRRGRLLMGKLRGRPRPAGEGPAGPLRRLSPPADLYTEKQIRKLLLEMEDLKRRIKWEHGFGRYFPVASVLVGVFGLAFGFYQFQAQQWARHEQNIREQAKDRAAREVDQMIRLQTQIRSDINQLLEFTRDEKQTISTAAFLLSDLKTIFNSRLDEGRTVDSRFPGYVRNLTENLVRKIKYDCDFIERPRDLGFAIAVIDHWDDYSSYLREDLRALDYLLYMHMRAMHHLRDNHPAYFKALKFNPEAGGYEVPPGFERMPGEERLYQHFLDVTNGFKKHVSVLDADPREEAKQLREMKLREFQAALCNESVARFVLGTYYPDQECH